MGDEPAAQEMMAKNWAQYSCAHKTQSVAMTTPGGPSYVELISCLDIMRDVEAIRKSRPILWSARSRAKARSFQYNNPRQVQTMSKVSSGAQRPDLIICDYHLANGESGIAAIADLRKACGTPVPAFIMSGDTTPERLREARESGHLLLHKPLRAMALRAMINRLLKSSSVAGAA